MAAGSVSVNPTNTFIVNSQRPQMGQTYVQPPPRVPTPQPPALTEDDKKFLNKAVGTDVLRWRWCACKLSQNALIFRGLFCSI